MGAPQHGFALPPHQLILDERPDMLCSHRIQARGRLVEQQYCGVGEQGTRDGQPLPLPGGKGHESLVRHVFHPDQAQQLRNPRFFFSPLQTAERCKKIQILPDRKPPVKTAVIGGHQAHLGLDRQGKTKQIDAAYLGGPMVGNNQGRQNLDQGGLTRPIDAQQVGFVQQVLAAAPRAISEEPVRCVHTGCLIAADARVDNRDDLIAALQLQRTAASLTDTELILAGYLHWGEQVAAQLIGDFAFAVWDPRRDLFFCARDRMGVKPLYYLHQGDLFACASHPAPLTALPGMSVRPDEQRLACYLLNILPEDTATFYEAIHRLPPGFSLTATASGVALHQYWSPLQVKTSKLKDTAAYASTFQALFAEAVRCRLRDVGSVGSTLSGGLDSSSITCLASTMVDREKGERLHAFSAIFPSLPPHLLARIDERNYMEAVLQWCHPEAHAIRADELQPFATLAEDLESAGQPFFGPNMYMHNGMYESAARHGVKVFLDGTDGDSVISYGFERLPSLLLTGAWPSLRRELIALKRVSRSGQSLSRLLKSYALKPALTGWVQSMGLGGMLPENRRTELVSFLQPAFKERVGAAGLLDRHILRTRLPVVDACAHHRASLALPYLSHILESCTLFANRYGIETRFPFLDHRLVEFCLSLPSDQKLANGWSRAIQRRAMSGLVPEAVLRRITKADLGPNYYLGLAKHGSQVLEETIRPAQAVLDQYLQMNRLLPRLEACVAAPEANKETAVYFFQLACLAMWLSPSKAGV